MHFEHTNDIACLAQMFVGKAIARKVIADLCVTGVPIRHMRVPIQPFRTTGSWEYLPGSWREATPHVY